MCAREHLPKAPNLLLWSISHSVREYRIISAHAQASACPRSENGWRERTGQSIPDKAAAESGVFACDCGTGLAGGESPFGMRVDMNHLRIFIKTSSSSHRRAERR